MNSAGKIPLIDVLTSASGQAPVVTRAAHIIPESTNAGISGDNEGGDRVHLLSSVFFHDQYEYAASVWAALERFGQVSLDGLNGRNIHRLENIITMDNNKHDMFSRLLVWFEATVI